ncbi:hydrolase, partial [Oryctes borbonicus]
MSATLGPLKIIKQKNAINTGTVIFFHGSGDTGSGILDWVKFLIGDFTSPHLKFLFPTAPLRPYTPLNGEMSHVWFDRYDITPTVPEHEETLASIDDEIKNLIAGELANGTPLNKIVVGGFSMGGALALHTAYRSVPGLAGVFALSSFLNDDSIVYKALQDPSEGPDTPFIMFHGDHDTLVPSA